MDTLKHLIIFAGIIFLFSAVDSELINALFNLLKSLLFLSILLILIGTIKT